MPFLTLGATTLETTSLEETEPVEVGDRYETFNGSERTSIYTRKRRFRGVTRPLTLAEHTSYRTAIEAAPPVTATGDAIGTMTVSGRVLGVAYVRDRTGHTRVLSFELRQR
jgi:hypothetical protein